MSPKAGVKKAEVKNERPAKKKAKNAETWTETSEPEIMKG